LGLGFYGRSFALDDSSSTTPGCAFYKNHNSTGGAAAGECTGTSGILSNYEINRIIENNNPTIDYSEEAAVNWMTWYRNQW
jgi:chitinase